MSDEVYLIGEDNFSRENRDYVALDKMMRLYITGGGGKLIENFGNYDKDRVTIIGDICASAKGYEFFATAQLRKECK